MSSDPLNPTVPPELFRALEAVGLEVSIGLWEEFGGAAWVADVTDGRASAVVTIGSNPSVKGIAMREALSRTQVHGENPDTASSVKGLVLDDQLLYVRGWLQAKAAEGAGLQRVVIDPASISPSPLASTLEVAHTWGLGHYFRRRKWHRKEDLVWFDPRNDVAWEPRSGIVHGIRLAGTELQFPSGAIAIGANSTLVALTFGLIDGFNSYSEW